MKNTIRILLMITGAAWLLAGCGDSFPDEEMHLGVEDKSRPLTVICDPPEVSPGDSVTVTLLLQTPRPDDVLTGWRVALDYNIGLYEADQVERRYVDLDSEVTIPDPVPDPEGFLRQTFSWVVPDSTLLWSSGQPEVLTDEIIVYLASELLGGQASDPPLKSEVDAYLSALTADDLAAMDPLTRQAVWMLSDLFACQIRFRCALEANQTVDVTRNLTVRYSRRLGSPNINLNADISSFAVAAVPRADAKWSDVVDLADEVRWFHFMDGSGAVNDVVEVPRHENWTYYATVRFTPQQYTSPFSGDRVLHEVGTYRWYYYRLDAPLSGHQLYVTEEGEEAEMWNLDENARMKPPAGVVSRYRLVGCVRDERSEWARYHATPGATLVGGEVVFVDP